MRCIAGFGRPGILGIEDEEDGAGAVAVAEVFLGAWSSCIFSSSFSESSFSLSLSEDEGPEDEV